MPILRFSIFQACKAPNIWVLNRLRIQGTLGLIWELLPWASLTTFFSLSASSILKREKRLRTKNVHFSCVTVYYFTRRQGFTSVPSQGGSTLGMSSRHNSVRQYTLGEFAREQERLHREMLREHLREEKLNSLKLKVKRLFAFRKNLLFLERLSQPHFSMGLTLFSMTDKLPMDYFSCLSVPFFFLQSCTLSMRLLLDIIYSSILKMLTFGDCYIVHHLYECA